MNNDHSIGIVILLGLIAIILFGGVKNMPVKTSTTSTTTNTTGSNTNTNTTTEQNQQDIQQEINSAKIKTEDLKKQIQIEEDKKTQSVYKDIVTLDTINRSDDPGKEYLQIRVQSNASGSIPVTGWTLKSKNSGATVVIPKGTYLFYAGVLNSDENIILLPGDTLYLITGISPNGASFKVNKCSGYLEQFQTFSPYLGSSCPAPRNENLSEIPKTSINDACLDYIENMPICRIQTENVPQNWTYECTNFIYNKVNYPTCVNNHRNDTDFYKQDWRVYLKRTEHIWKSAREDVVLYDNTGKIVDELTY